MRLRYDKKLKQAKRYYFFQCLLGTIYVGAVIYVVTSQHAAIVASIGASVFIVLASPHGYYSRPQNLIGGHMAGLTFGAFFSIVQIPNEVIHAIAAALAVGCTFIAMVALDIEHPPAAGTALGVVFVGFSLPLATMIIVAVILLSIGHTIMKPWMRDLI